MLWAVMFSVQNALSNQPDRVYAFKFSLTGDNPIPSIPLLYASGTTFFMICNAALTSLLIMIFFLFLVWYQCTIVTGIGSIIADLYSVAVLP